MVKINKEEISNILKGYKHYCAIFKGMNTLFLRDFIIDNISSNYLDIKEVTHAIFAYYEVNNNENFVSEYIDFMQRKNDLYNYASLNPNPIVYGRNISSSDSIAMRIDDKLQRLESIQKDEEDTILDIAGYCILLLHSLNLENQ